VEQGAGLSEALFYQVFVWRYPGRLFEPARNVKHAHTCSIRDLLQGIRRMARNVGRILMP
jgi:hypothetical protein